MLWVPSKGQLRTEHNYGAVGTTTLGTTVTTGGAAATKGTAVALIASTSFDAYWVTITAAGYGLAVTSCEGVMDLLIGAATEEVLIANLMMGWCGGDIINAGAGPRRWDFPLYIPAGSRLACQAAGARTAAAVQVGICLYGGDGYPRYKVAQKVTTYGMGTVPNGTTIVPGQTGAEGAWTQITAATSEDHFALVPGFQSSTDTTVQNRSYFVDIGVGAATEEQVGEYIYLSSQNEQYGGPLNSMPVFQDIPSGTRLSMRASSSAATLDVAYNGIIHALS